MDTDAYQEEMINLRHNLNRNNYPERITSAQKCSNFFLVYYYCVSSSEFLHTSNEQVFFFLKSLNDSVTLGLKDFFY